MKCLPFSADHQDQLILFRTCVSRNAASKGRAVLEGVGLSAETIEACFNSHPLNEEEAVQAGLTQWSGGQGRQPPTWQVLLGAMTYAQIAQEHVQELKDKFAQGMLLAIYRVQCVDCVCVCVCVCVCAHMYVCACIHVLVCTTSLSRGAGVWSSHKFHHLVLCTWRVIRKDGGG